MSLNLTINQLEFNREDGINLVFIGDGFTSAQQTAYHNKVQVAINGMFSFNPFNQFRNYFNIYSIPTVSNESGISTITHPNNPVTPVIKDTFLGAYFNEGGMIRLTSFTKKEELEIELTKVFKNRVFVILICNTPTYGGSGMFPDDKFLTITQVTMETQYNTFKELLIHEFGHSFCGLADEYGGNCMSDKPANFALPLYDRPNVTNDIVNNRKWDNIVENPQYVEGANYCNTGWWRSSVSSIMRNWFEPGTLLDQQFNDVSVYHIIKRIRDEFKLAKKTDTYLGVNIINNRYNLLLRLSSFLSSNRNIRVNGILTVNKPISCTNLWINKGAILIIGPGGGIRCKKMINNGVIENQNRITFFR